METAAAIGITISDFYKMTPRELFIYIKGFNVRKELEIEEYKAKFEAKRKLSIYQAFLISRWVWTKTVNIEQFLEIKEENKKVMTDEEMLNQARILNKMFGGTEK